MLVSRSIVISSAVVSLTVGLATIVNAVVPVSRHFGELLDIAATAGTVAFMVAFVAFVVTAIVVGCVERDGEWVLFGVILGAVCGPPFLWSGLPEAGSTDARVAGGIVLLLLATPVLLALVGWVADHVHDLRPCPMCAEHVKAEARLCRYCGHRLTQTSGNALSRT